MSPRAKFLFDTDFAPGGALRGNTVPLAQHQAELAEAESCGYRRGVAAGKAEMASDAERRMAAALERAAASLQALARGLGDVEARLEAEAVEVALATARKLAGTLVEREPFAEIAALAADCFRHLVGAPHVVVRVHDTLHEGARERLTAIAQRCGFDGRLIVLAEPEIAAGDCRLEWADGGAMRDRATIEAAVASAVERYLVVRRPGAAAHEAGSSA